MLASERGFTAVVAVLLQYNTVADVQTNVSSTCEPICFRSVLWVLGCVVNSLWPLQSLL